MTDDVSDELIRSGPDAVAVFEAAGLTFVRTVDTGVLYGDPDVQVTAAADAAEDGPHQVRVWAHGGFFAIFCYAEVARGGTAGGALPAALVRTAIDVARADACRRARLAEVGRSPLRDGARADTRSAQRSRQQIREAS